MSKSTKASEHEDVDENVLFDDGFSVIDDINAATGSAEGDRKSNDEKKEDVITKEVVDVNVNNKNTAKDTDKMEKKENSKACSDSSTLILSNDDDLVAESSVPDASKVKLEKEEPEAVSATKETKIEPSPNQESNKTVAKKTPLRKKGPSSSYVWITNISNSVNASSLKKHFSDCGRVNTAKVVTNGRLFFGYVEFDTPQIALDCVEKMNNTILGGKKISVSRNRPDVTKRGTAVQKKTSKPETGRKSEVIKKEVVAEQKNKDEKKEDVKSGTDDKKKIEKVKEIVQDKSKVDDKDKKKKTVDKPSDTKVKSAKEEAVTKDDLRQQMKETRRKLDLLRTALDRTQIEVRNLRRRLTTEQKKTKAEEMRAERYRQQMRKLGDEIKEAKEEFRKDVHRLNKKHKLEMDKAGLERDSLLKREDDLRRRQEDLSREFKKLEEAKKSFEHLKRSRKSRSISPPSKRFRGRDVAYPDVSPPPPPKLSGDTRKPLLERPPYFDEKKPRGVYDRLGDYVDKPIPRESSNGRYRSSYQSESMAPPKSTWIPHTLEPWKKSSSQANTGYLKPYMERYGQDGYQGQSSSYYPPGTTDYPKRFESSRKY